METSIERSRQMFKYVWIIILILVSIFGWTYSIYDIVLTIRNREKDADIFDIFHNLEDFTQFWIVLYTLAVFMVSFILYMIAKSEGV